MIVSVEGSSRAEMAVEAGADDEAGSQQAVCRKWFALGKDSVDTGALGDRVSWSLSVDEGGESCQQSWADVEEPFSRRGTSGLGVRASSRTGQEDRLYDVAVCF